MDYFKKFVRINGDMSINGVGGVFDGETFKSHDGETTFSEEMVGVACNAYLANVTQEKDVNMLKAVLKRGNYNCLVEDTSIDIIDGAHVTYLRFSSEFKMFDYQGFVYIKGSDTAMCYGESATCKRCLICLYLWLYEVQDVKLSTHWDILLYGHREYPVETPYGCTMIQARNGLDVGFAGWGSSANEGFTSYVLKLYMQKEADRKCMVSYDNRLRSLEKTILENKKHILQYPGYGVLPRWLTFSYAADSCGRFCRITTSSGRLLLVTTTNNNSEFFRVWTAEGVSIWDAIEAITTDFVYEGES